MVQGRDLLRRVSGVGSLRRACNPPSQGASLVPGAGIQAVGEGLQGPVLITRRAKAVTRIIASRPRHGDRGKASVVQIRAIIARFSSRGEVNP